jgi:hypothetical protein
LVSDAEIDEALSLLGAALAEVARSTKAAAS